jgi:hypothetical protein
VKAGFNKYPNWRIEVLSFQDVQAEKLNQLTATVCNILSPNEVEKAELIAYDSQIAGSIDRGDFFTSWTSHPDGYTKVAITYLLFLHAATYATRGHHLLFLVGQSENLSLPR